MSFGLRCFDGGGNVYFDTTVQNHYRLIGKLLDSWSNYYGVKIPAKYNNEDHLFCVGLKDWKSQYYGNKRYLGIFNANGFLRFEIHGRYHNTDNIIPPLEIFVFSKKPADNATDGFGITCYDENMGMTFSTFNTSHCLQINDYKRQASPFQGVVGTGNAILISSLPYQAFSSGAGYALVESCMFRVEGVVVESSYGSIGSQYVPGGYSFPHFSVATVQIPDMPIPTLSW